MTKEEVLEKYPNLVNMSPLDLVIMRKQAMDLKDDEFRQAIDALIKPEKKES